LDSDSGSARRSVIEAAWEITPNGYRNEYLLPANNREYSLSYDWCKKSEVMIVIIYRKSSGAWQYALKGKFIAFA
jgi:hypothetical protein